MGKCKFSELWLEDSRFKDWLRPVIGKSREAFCNVCKKNSQHHLDGGEGGKFAPGVQQPPGQDEGAKHTAAALAFFHSGSYVLMFDESLNVSLKKKQMDVHIRFLEDGCVRSRYFGSQFLGHGRAEDLLQHIKVSLISYRLLIGY